MYSVNKYLFHPDMTCQKQIISECQVGCPIRKFPDQSLFAAPQDLSQRTTSFIASYRQGIHQTPFSRLIRPSERRTTHRLAKARPPHDPSITWIFIFPFGPVEPCSAGFRLGKAGPNWSVH